MKHIKRIFAFSFLSATLVLSGCGSKATPYQVSLEIWGTFDSSDAYQEIISAYKEINPKIKDIRYRKISADTYEKDLNDALISGNSPDIFLINNTWLPAFINAIEPMPVKLANTEAIKQNFPDIVTQDFVVQDKIYSVPLSIDSLALYYNKTHFNVAGITSPPTTWSEFDEDVKKLTKIDETGNIVQSGTALGTAANINRFSDVLGMLMMQNKTQMTSDDNKRATFANKTKMTNGDQIIPGDMALKYYTQFSDPNSSLYSWNNEMHYSIDAFAEGRLSMMFNYSWHIDTIKNKDAKLSFDIAPIPQDDSLNQLTLANYWSFVVSKNKIIAKSTGKTPAGNSAARVHEAWQFLKYLTMKNSGTFKMINAYSGTVTEGPMKIDPAAKYIEKTGNPAARRDLIENQKNVSMTGVFAKGNLIAKRWYQKNPKDVEKIFMEMVDAVSRGGMATEEALNRGASRLSETMR